MPLYFCSVVCWDSHLSTVRHRDAYAVEVHAPTREHWQKQQADAAAAPAPRAMPATPDRVNTASGANPAPRPMPQASAPAQVTTRKVMDAPPAPASGMEGNVAFSEVTDKDVLIVVSKMKKYIKDRSGMNCSDSVADMISEHVRAVCDEAIRSAARNERKTVLDRDVPKARR
jgi:histone H3/H4